ncbi:hypothetical protein C8Q69DRAFT_336601 [Paecilomyces variotii]|uniref:BTB domain-containing protein n=1 Tax=Byssochlamys spectabilis TaxID=264951 RepID=A0A443HPR8_BYSSP|nr:hypothetical protein C8Q69DRAFT_336601 [Paecilomyces variotii]RWQ93823.1 hypothetical protein C8Q69DRAFT_336601 [Paecilomyces variotii]
MDNPEVQIPPAENIDVEMEETREPVEQQKDGTGEPVEQQQDAESTQDATVVTTQDDSVAVQEKNEGLKFIDHLKSPVVELVVGQGDDQTVLTAHEGFLKESPFFSEAVAAFKDGEARRINLPDESIDAVGCFLQFQYTGDYFPRRLQTPGGGLEHDPTAPDVDDTGDQLLKHARVYTLAEKLGVPALKTLAHSKIHRISSTARGEIAYARYVYANTSADDVVIRKPIAAFWATRSHVLRHEAEMEFRTMCLEFPQFGFDVLSLVLDQKEKRSQDKADADSTVKGSARKRPRSGL